MDWRNVQFYSSLGWSLFPCSNRSKAPLVATGFKAATTDVGQLKAWHQQFPACAWGCATSAERGVLDIDPRNGGDKTLASLEATHGPLPPTPKVRTGGNGLHYWLRFPAGTGCGVVAEGIDRKASGGYVIIPPSKIDCPEHAGRSYAWELRPWECAIAEAPAWVVGLNARAEPKAVAGASADASDPWVVRPSGDDLLTHPGASKDRGEQRRPMLCRLVGIHLARGDSEASVYAMAEAWAARCTPPLEPHQWEPHVERLMAKEEAKQEARGLTRPSPTPSGIVEYRDDSLVPPEETLRQETNSDAGAGAEAELVSSELVSSGEADQGGEVGAVSSDWPTLRPEARHGLLGSMLDAVEPETEADPTAVLLGFLTCFGNIVGRGAWVQVGADPHHPALFVGVVGKSSDAKGVSWGVSRWPFAQAEPAWAKACVCNGIGSGEGLVERVADEQTVVDKTGNVMVFPGAPDKRCLIRLSEFSRCFKAQRRENSTLSEYLREAWDGGAISIPNRKTNAIGTSGYAISLYGDITPGVIRQTMGAGTEAFDGFANRFLWAAVRSDRDISEGGNIIHVLEPFIGQLQEALAFGKTAGAITRDADAKRLWGEVYGLLKRCGDSVPHTDRARPYVVRLSLIYALADKSHVITEAHLRAALAVWDYCRQSASLVFSGSVQTEVTAVPEPLWFRLLNAITAKPGVRRGELTERFKHEANAEGIGAALTYLERNGMAYRLEVKPEGGGRPAECWFPGASREGEAESLSDDTLPLLPPPSDDPWVVRAAEAPEETICQETNSAPTGGVNFLAGVSSGGEREAEGVYEAGGSEGGVNRMAFAHEPNAGVGVSGEPDVFDPDTNAFAQRLDAAEWIW